MSKDELILHLSKIKDITILKKDDYINIINIIKNKTNIYNQN